MTNNRKLVKFVLLVLTAFSLELSIPFKASAQVFSRNLECRSYQVLFQDETERASNEFVLIAKVDVETKLSRGRSLSRIKNISDIQWGADLLVGADRVSFREVGNLGVRDEKVIFSFSPNSSENYQLSFDRVIEDWNSIKAPNKNRWAHAVFEGRLIGNGQFIEAFMNCVVSNLQPTEGVLLALDALKEQFKDGRHFYFPLSAPFTSHLMHSIQEVIWLSHGDDTKDWPKSSPADKKAYLNGFEWVENSVEFQADKKVAGTLPLSVVAMRLFELVPDSTITFQILEYLLAIGIEFGFDGWQQNACAAPTEALLLVDRVRGQAWSIDLTPCSE